MNVGVLAWLTRLLWTPKPTRSVVGLPRSITERVLPSIRALTPHTPDDIAAEVRAEALDIFSECLTERGIPLDAYILLIEPDPDGYFVARAQRVSDQKSWSLPEFDEFLDFGLEPNEPVT